MFGRIGGGYDGRCGAGRVDTPPGPPPGPPGLARFPVAGGSGAEGRGGATLSDGRKRVAAGRVGIAGTDEVPGAFGSSILSLMDGGTMRPGNCAAFGEDAAVAVTGAGSAGASAWSDGASSTAGASASTTSPGTSSGSSNSVPLGGGDMSSTNCSSSGAASANGAEGAGLTVLTRRGGASVGAAGLTGSAFLPANPGFFAPGLATGPSANMSPPGSVMPRSRARRSTNWRATTSSIVLEALFSSMPCARFRSASTSWLLVLSSSATL